MTVTYEWARITGWCRVNAPTTFAEIYEPDPEATAAARARFGDWGPELDEWFSLHGGASWTEAHLLPGFALMTPG